MPRKRLVHILALLALACPLGLDAQSPTRKRATSPPAKGVPSPEAPPRDLLLWSRPRFIVDKLPISRSATCRFKRSLNAIYDQRTIGSAQIYYTDGAEDEADTVSFVDLDTDHPQVQSNNGQARLLVLSDHHSQIALLNREGVEGGPLGVEVYTIFKDFGIIIHSTQHMVLGIASGVLEMGYCN